MTATLKLSSPDTQEFWEIPVLFEDEHLFAVNKPAGLPTSPPADDPEAPSLLKLLHTGIEQGKAWARERRLDYLMNIHRLDSEATGVVLFARDKRSLETVANLLGSGVPCREFVALIRGRPAEPSFSIDAPLATHRYKAGLMQVDPKRGKKSRTTFETREHFRGYTLLTCRPLTDRNHQVRVHLRYARLQLVGDRLYGGRPLFLSSLKPDYRLKPNHDERPLASAPALHAEALSLPHPVTGAPLKITAEWPKDLSVAVKYLRRYALATERMAEEPVLSSPAN